MLSANTLPLMSFNVSPDNFYTMLHQLLDQYDKSYYPYASRQQFPLKPNDNICGLEFHRTRISLEAFILFSSVLIDIPWENEKHWFYQYNDHILYREWINK